MTVSRPLVARLRRAAGFTLIELMVVLVIIGVLA
ncbi:MAG TPA: prepilin-type N-terminal cleavage/methylation domain-containing protein, partial [Ottowia sp.]|nr:prepilin-type N-terminal cleavage/methylation domain-containing protein [Ottowia sp.]